LHGQRQQKAHKTEKKTLSAEEQDAGKGRCRQKRACRVQTEEEEKKKNDISGSLQQRIPTIENTCYVGLNETNLHKT